MKTVWKSFLRDRCRAREVTEEERAALPEYTHLQRYFPALDVFRAPEDAATASLELPSQYYVKGLEMKDDRWGSAQRFEYAGEQKDACGVFVKTVHLIHPIDRLRETYTAPPHPLLPATSEWVQTVAKIHRRNNQAYVDAVANFVLSRYRERDLLPHFVLYYGAYTAIKRTYRYNMTEEYQSYRQCRWFWDGLAAHQGRVWADREILSAPSLSSLDSDASDASDEEIAVSDVEATWLPLEDVSDVSEASEASDSSEASEASETEIIVEVPNIPVMAILQEAQQGSMDELLDEELDREGERKWSAWLFQVVATLTFLQNALSFTHNDLHTNNLVWQTTDEPYLYYRLKGRTVWRVPTYGKIFRIIDFGRAIFRIGRHQWISDDHWPHEDAAGQYNYGPFYDKKEPEVRPNPSFDLCRLAVSLLSGLYPERPPKKKKGRVMSQEGTWKVYETQSALYNLLWRWTLDDEGRTVYETEDGYERYDGFDLYVQMGHHVHGAVPSEQLHAGLFQGWVWKQPVPADQVVYSLD